VLYSAGKGGDIVKELRVNRRIDAREVLLIAEDGEQVGVLPVRDALNMARERELDLVEVAPNSNPPVCRLLDYGKYRYEQGKKEKEARKGQKAVHLREVRMRCRIKEQDLGTKVKLIKRLLGEGDKVKVTMIFRGREIAHPERGRDLFREMASQLKDVALVDQPQISERSLSLVFSPIKQSKGSSKDQSEEQSEDAGKSVEEEGVGAED